MPFPRRHLGQHEEVVVELKPHWTFLARPVLAFAVSAGLVGALHAWRQGLPSSLFYALLALPALGALWVLGRFARWTTNLLTITTVRIVRRTGIVSRRGLEVRLERVNQLYYEQTLWQRMLRTGRFIVEVGGQSGVVVFENVPHPASLVSLVNEQISALRGFAVRAQDGDDGTMSAGTGSSPRAASGQWDGRPPASGPYDRTPPRGTRIPSGALQEDRPEQAMSDAAQRLVELDELRRRGIVTEAEYNAKKAELLDLL